ncbi:hypothetical protein EIP91_011052 [Steccherinum ochraceum]|uniref:Uncharacterized protein n=1 Tax=Steccherinum ochraceum TaxID=92696 RepID=A0A4R0RR63_9APHY|nr:hypothetical protein EIP91_011052 [Steccherinum ochraceum]
MSGSENGDDIGALQQLLEAHGQKFLESFDSNALASKRKGPLRPDAVRGKKRKASTPSATDEAEEWTGFSGSVNMNQEEEEALDEEATESDQSTDEDEEPLPRRPDIVVFSDTRSQADAGPSTSKAQMRAFMSSKASNLNKAIKEEDEEAEGSSEDENDLTNLQNDALLHRLVHTTLLSGSLEPDLDVKPAKRRKALAGRVIEVAGGAKLGKGESSVRTAERNKASKRVREGMLAKQAERNQKALGEAKDMGNYHPALKQLYEASSSKPDRRKRDRGLRMGIGNFSGERAGTGTRQR